MDNQPLPCPMCGKHALQMITGDVVCQSGNCGLRLTNLEGEAYATIVERWNRHYCTRRASRSSVPPTPTKIPVIEPDGKAWLDDLTTKLIDLRNEAADAAWQCEHRDFDNCAHAERVAKHFDAAFRHAHEMLVIAKAAVDEIREVREAAGLTKGQSLLTFAAAARVAHETMTAWKKGTFESDSPAGRYPTDAGATSRRPGSA